MNKYLREANRKKKESVVSFMHEQNIICSQTLSQTQLDDDIALDETIIQWFIIMKMYVGTYQTSSSSFISFQKYV